LHDGVRIRSQPQTGPHDVTTMVDSPKGSAMGDRIDDLSERVQTVEEKLDRLSGSVDQRFGQIDERFEQVDRRFEQVDRRFEQIDRRFEQVDRRFEQVDRRFDQIDAAIVEQRQYTEFAYARLETKMDAGFSRVERKLDQFIDVQLQTNQLVDRRLQALEQQSPGRDSKR